jgi:hypothetical protein
MARMRMEGKEEKMKSVAGLPEGGPVFVWVGEG